MADDFRVDGAEQMFALAKSLKAAGEKDLRRELNRRMRAAAKPLIPKTRAAARSVLPTRGGLADSVAKAPQRVSVRTTRAKSAGVTMVVGKRRGSGARSADEGTIRHPVFGQGWVDQPVTPGWFTGTLEREADSVLPAVRDALRDVANGVIRETKKAKRPSRPRAPRQTRSAGAELDRLADTDRW